MIITDIFFFFLIEKTLFNGYGNVNQVDYWRRLIKGKPEWKDISLTNIFRLMPTELYYNEEFACIFGL